jgi:hypothetical protein
VAAVGVAYAEEGGGGDVVASIGPLASVGYLANAGSLGSLGIGHATLHGNGNGPVVSIPAMLFNGERKVSTTSALLSSRQLPPLLHALERFGENNLADQLICFLRTDLMLPPRLLAALSQTTVHPPTATLRSRPSSARVFPRQQRL